MSKATSLNISWDNIVNATLYKLVYTGGSIKEERELKTDQNFVDIVGLTKNTTYNVTVLVTEINNRIPENAAQSNWYAFTTTSEGKLKTLTISSLKALNNKVRGFKIKMYLIIHTRPRTCTHKNSISIETFRMVRINIATGVCRNYLC